MTSRLATVRRRSLPLILALLGLAGWTTSIQAAAPSPEKSASASTENVVGLAVPWQLAPGLLAPALMPEAYYVTTGTTTATTGTPTTVGKVPDGGGGSKTPGGPGITIQGNPTPNSSPEPASLITSVIGIGFVSFKLWRRRFKKVAPEPTPELAVQV